MTGELRCWHTLLLLLLLLVLFSTLEPLAAAASSSASFPPAKTFPPDPPIPPNIGRRHGGTSPSSSSSSSSFPFPPKSVLAFLNIVTASSSSPSSSSPRTSSLSSPVLSDSSSPFLPPQRSDFKETSLDAATDLALSSSKPSQSSSLKSSTHHIPSIHFPAGDMKTPYSVNTSNTSPATLTPDHHHHIRSNKNHSYKRTEEEEEEKKKTSSVTPKSRANRAKFSEKNAKALQALERMFLKNAGLRQRPKVKRDWAVPHYMLDLYKTQLDMHAGSDMGLKLKGRGLVAANTVRSFVHTDTESEGCKPPLCSRIRFDVSTFSEEETVTGAELRIFVGESPEDKLSTGKSDTPSAQQGALGRPRQRQDSSSYLARLEIHQIIKPASPPSPTLSPSGGDDAITRLLDTRVVDARNTSWHSFDVHPAVLRWKRLGQAHNHGLEIRLAVVRQEKPQSQTRAVSQAGASNAGVRLSTDNHVRVRRAAHLPDRDWALQKPLLVTFTDDGFSPPLFSQSSSFPSQSSSKTRSSSRFSSSGRRLKTTLRRRKRSTGSKKDTAKKSGKKKRRKNRRKNRRRRKRKRRRKKKGNKNICKKHSLYVDFRDVGWDDWIVAPAGYHAYYCHGDCTAPIPDFAKASNHAMLQARVYKVNPSAVPMVCCVPIKMAPISMLYRDENDQVLLKNYEDMAVEECGCK